MQYTKNMEAIQPLWDTLTLCERQVFISRECAQLICDFRESRDHDGLDILYEHLTTLVDFTDTMTSEMEGDIKRDAITATFKTVQDAFSKGTIDVALADTLASLSDNIREYATNHPTEEQLNQDYEEAYENVKTLLSAV